MAAGELAQLRLTLPVPIPEFVVERLSQQPLLGARLELPLEKNDGARLGATLLPPGSVDAGSLVVGCFDVARLLQEALDFEPGASLLVEGYLPFAGCGRRGTTLYVVTLRESSTHEAGEIHWVEGSAGARPSPLFEPNGARLRLDNLLRATRLAPSGSLRQRVQKHPKRPRGAHAPVRRRGRVQATSLALFESVGPGGLLQTPSEVNSSGALPPTPSALRLGPQPQLDSFPASSNEPG